MFGCHEWCDPSWSYTAESNDARDKIHTAEAAVAPTTTATDGEEVSIQSHDKVITPTECTFNSGARDKIHTAVATVAPTPTATDGDEVSIQFPNEVITPTECFNSSTILDVNLMFDDSSRFSAYSETSDSKEDIDTYKCNYVEEDKDIHFFRNLVPESIDGLETMVFSTTDLVVLKDKER